MPFRIERHPEYVKVEVTRRESAEETRAVAEAARAALDEGAPHKLLVVVRESMPIFRVEQYGLSSFLAGAARREGLRVALVADSPEVAASHQYIEVLAAQRGVAIRSFRDERAALAWLLA